MIKETQHRSMEKIAKKIEVPVAREKAYDMFVNGLHHWWPKEYTWSKEKLDTIKIDPRKDGLCSEIGPYDFRCDWGRVTKVEPYYEIDLKWQISPQRIPEPDPEYGSDIHVSFKEVSPKETVVHFEHSHFENHGDGFEGYMQAMDSSEGWDYILGRYLEYCRQ